MNKEDLKTLLGMAALAVALGLVIFALLYSLLYEMGITI